VVDVPFNYILNDASQQITTLLYIKRERELNKPRINSTDENPGLRIELAFSNKFTGCFHKQNYYFIAMQTYKELNLKEVNRTKSA
jgi:hypothetical protein